MPAWSESSKSPADSPFSKFRVYRCAKRAQLRAAASVGRGRWVAGFRAKAPVGRTARTPTSTVDYATTPISITGSPALTARPVMSTYTVPHFGATTSSNVSPKTSRMSPTS